jgi:hypothetical protein
MINDGWWQFIKELNKELQKHGLRLFDFGDSHTVVPINEEGQYLTSTAFAVYNPLQQGNASHQIWMIEFFPGTEVPDLMTTVRKVVDKFPTNAKLVEDGGKIPRWSPMRVGTSMKEVLE